AGAHRPLQRLEALKLGQDGVVDRLEGVRVGGQVGLVQPGQGRLNLDHRVGGAFVLPQRIAWPAHDTSCNGDNAGSIGGRVMRGRGVEGAAWGGGGSGRGAGGAGGRARGRDRGARWTPWVGGLWTAVRPLPGVGYPPGRGPMRRG